MMKGFAKGTRKKLGTVSRSSSSKKKKESRLADANDVQDFPEFGAVINGSSGNVLLSRENSSFTMGGGSEEGSLLGGTAAEAKQQRIAVKQSVDSPEDMIAEIENLRLTVQRLHDELEGDSLHQEFEDLKAQRDRWEKKYNALQSEYNVLEADYKQLVAANQGKMAGVPNELLIAREEQIRNLSTELDSLRKENETLGRSGKGLGSTSAAIRAAEERAERAERKNVAQNEEIQKLLEQRIELQSELSDMRLRAMSGGSQDTPTGAIMTSAGAGTGFEQERIINNLKTQLKQKDKDIEDITKELNAARNEVSRLSDIVGVVAGQMEETEVKNAKKKTWWGGKKKSSRKDADKLHAADLAAINREASSYVGGGSEAPDSPRSVAASQTSNIPGISLPLPIVSRSSAPAAVQGGSLLSRGGGDLATTIMTRAMGELQHENGRLEGEVGILEKEKGVMEEKIKRLEAQLEVLQKARRGDEAGAQAVAITKSLAMTLPQDGGSENDRLRALIELQQAALQKLSLQKCQAEDSLDNYTRRMETFEFQMAKKEEAMKQEVISASQETSLLRREKVKVEKELLVLQAGSRQRDVELRGIRDSLEASHKVTADSARKYKAQSDMYATMVSNLLKENEDLQASVNQLKARFLKESATYEAELRHLQDGRVRRLSGDAPNLSVFPSLPSGLPIQPLRIDTSQSVSPSKPPPKPSSPVDRSAKVPLISLTDHLSPSGKEASPRPASLKRGDDDSPPTPSEEPAPLSVNSNYHYRWQNGGYRLKAASVPTLPREQQQRPHATTKKPAARPSHHRSASLGGIRPAVSVEIHPNGPSYRQNIHIGIPGPFPPDANSRSLPNFSARFDTPKKQDQEYAAAVLKEWIEKHPISQPTLARINGRERKSFHKLLEPHKLPVTLSKYEAATQVNGGNKGHTPSFLTHVYNPLDSLESAPNATSAFYRPSMSGQRIRPSHNLGNTSDCLDSRLSPMSKTTSSAPTKASLAAALKGLQTPFLPSITGHAATKRKAEGHNVSLLPLGESLCRSNDNSHYAMSLPRTNPPVNKGASEVSLSSQSSGTEEDEQRVPRQQRQWSHRSTDNIRGLPVGSSLTSNPPEATQLPVLVGGAQAESSARRPSKPSEETQPLPGPSSDVSSTPQNQGQLFRLEDGTTSLDATKQHTQGGRRGTGHWGLSAETSRLSSASEPTQEAATVKGQRAQPEQKPTAPQVANKGIGHTSDSVSTFEGCVADTPVFATSPNKKVRGCSVDQLGKTNSPLAHESSFSVPKNYSAMPRSLQRNQPKGATALSSLDPTLSEAHNLTAANGSRKSLPVARSPLGDSISSDPSVSDFAAMLFGASETFDRQLKEVQAERYSRRGSSSPRQGLLLNDLSEDSFLGVRSLQTGVAPLRDNGSLLRTVSKETVRKGSTFNWTEHRSSKPFKVGSQELHQGSGDGFLRMERYGTGELLLDLS